MTSPSLVWVMDDTFFLPSVHHLLGPRTFGVDLPDESEVIPYFASSPEDE